MVSAPRFLLITVRAGVSGCNIKLFLVSCHQNYIMNTNIKTLLSFIVIGLAVVLPDDISAQDFEYEYQGNRIYYTVIDSDAKTCGTKAGYWVGKKGVSPNKVDGTVTIPEVVEYNNEQYTVVEIGDLSFYENYMKTIYLPNTVRIIGEHAFDYCRYMSHIQLPEYLEIIKDYGFSSCGCLAQIDLPFTVRHIGKEAFSASGLNSIIIPYGIEEINEATFAGCYHLTEVDLPESLISIGDEAFYLCLSLSSIYIPNSVKYIGDSAFHDIDDVKELTLGKSLISIGEHNFDKPITKLVSLSPVAPEVGRRSLIYFAAKAKAYVPNSTVADWEKILKNSHGDSTYPLNIIGMNPLNMSLEPTTLTMTVGETVTVDFNTDIPNNQPYYLFESKYLSDKISFEMYDQPIRYDITALAPGYAVFRVIQLELKHYIQYKSYCYITVISEEDAGVNPVINDNEFDDSAVRYYNLSGVLVNPDNLVPGIYIRQHKGETKKILIR